MSGRPDVRLSFAGGEVGEEHLARPDEAAHYESCKSLLNMYPTVAGRARRRPGSAQMFTKSGEQRIFMFRLVDDYEVLTFTAGSVTVHSSSGTLLQTLSSAPWTAPHLPVMTVTSGVDEVYVAHQSFWTQSLKRSSSGTWSRADLAFDDAAGGGLRQPYYRFGDRGVTMYVNGFSGTGVQILFSSGVLEAGHVGRIFRYAERIQVLVKSRVSSTEGTVDILGKIFPAVQVPVEDNSKFQIGDIVQGEILQGRGVVTALPTGKVEVQMIDSYDTFKNITEAGADKDRVIGPNGSSDVTGALATNAAPRSISLWDEAMFSSVRGYPGAATEHKGRLLLARYPQAPALLTGSAVNRVNDFLVPADSVTATDPFSAPLKSSSAEAIRHLISTEQLLVATNKRMYYVPESGENPLTPESLLQGGFNFIADIGSTDCPPVVTGLGVLMVQDDPARLMLVAPTGNVRASWQVVDLSYRASHLLNSPVRLAVADGFSGREKLIVIVNGDGTVAVASQRAGDALPGFAPWVIGGSGAVEDVFTEGRETLMVTRRGSTRHVSKLTDAARVDDEVGFTASVAARANTAQQVVKSLAVIGTVTLNGSGTSATIPPASGQTIGWDFQTELIPAPPRNPAIMHRYQRISRCIVDAKAGDYRIGGVVQPSKRGGDDLSLPTPTRRRTDEQDLLGWDTEPLVAIAQEVGDGSELEIYSVRMMVES